MNKKYIITTFILALVFVAGQATSASIKLNPIKPTLTSKNLTDEQQGILAVRTVKASVVNILGVPKAIILDSKSSETVTIGASASEVSGTGFILEQDGLIVTNNHVVESTTMDYTVVFADGTNYPANVLGRDKYDDIAILKIDAKNLPTVKLGDSDALETGQTVFAIGNSLGRYQNTVTRGVISGLSRAVDESNVSSLPTTHNWIQTDAAINLGNSGGPLINLSGEVIGMNTLFDTAGDSLGFALPVSLIKDAVEQLKTFGKVSRPYLGIKFMNIDTRLLLVKDLPVKNGALIIEVVKDSPAGNSGVYVNDIIIKIDGRLVNSQNPLDALVQKYQAGNQVNLTILRNEKEILLPIVLGELK